MAERDKRSDPQRDRVDRPEPPLDPAEGDEETIDEDLRNQEQKKA